MTRSPSGGLAATSVALLLLATAPSGCGGEGSQRFLSVGTGGTGGIYYPLGGALASRLGAVDSTRSYTAEVTGGSLENVNRVREGQIDLGFALSVTAYEAYHGGQIGVDQPFDALRIVAPLYPNLTHVLVPRGSDARSPADLRGTRLSVGSAGSGTEQMSRQLLEAYGMSYEDVEEQFLSFSESAAALRDGAIDGAIISVGYPAAAVLEATTTGGASLLPIEGEPVRVLRDRYPYYSVGEIPAGAYPGVDRPVPTVAMMNWIVAREDLAPSVVEDLLSIVSDGRAELVRIHEMARQIEVDALDDAPIPLHPATERWREARGEPAAAPTG